VTEAVLEVADLHVDFPTDDGPVQAVRGVSFEVAPGEVLGVVGESGSGKSVTFLAAMGLLPPTAVVRGSIKVQGEEMVGRNQKAIRRVRGQRIAMIFQDPLTALNPVHRVGNQIAEMVLAHNDIGKDAAARRAVELLDTVGIPQAQTRARQYPHEFSGGMRQRAMIAMAISNDPAVLIADEPTTALDTTVQAQILDVIERVKDELGSAVVFITHDLGVIARIADRVQVMYAGRIVEKATLLDAFERSAHPYTRGLLQAVPRADSERLVPIPGAPPNMLRPPSGCAFRVRCPYAIDECSEGLPTLHQVGPVETACIRAEHLVAEAVL
jgi:oligopeptide/dipeptide ABC transporter ATP-binding protein